MTKYILTQIHTRYMKVEGGEWENVKISSDYECINLDDLQNLILTLIECSTKPLRFEVTKVEVKDNE